jgi:hypothetical protein
MAMNWMTEVLFVEKAEIFLFITAVIPVRAPNIIYDEVWGYFPFC